MILMVLFGILGLFCCHFVKTMKFDNGQRRDPLLAKVKDFILHGWRNTYDNSLKPFQQCKNELSIESSCILWGNWVVVPPCGRQQVIDELHEGHPGISQMKSLARSFVWWPGMDNDLEKRWKNVSLARVLDIVHHRLLYTRGNCQNVHGHGYTHTMQVHFWVRCFLLS